jgi:hypothetical protein
MISGYPHHADTKPVLPISSVPGRPVAELQAQQDEQSREQLSQ